MIINIIIVIIIIITIIIFIITKFQLKRKADHRSYSATRELVNRGWETSLIAK